MFLELFAVKLAPCGKKVYRYVYLDASGNPILHKSLVLIRFIFAHLPKQNPNKNVLFC